MVQDSASGRVRHHLQTLVDTGSTGDRLPSVRQLMVQLGVSPGTVRHAVSDLVRSGAVEAISGSGTFIAAPKPLATSAPDFSWQTLVLGSDAEDRSALDPIREITAPGVIDLSSGYPEVGLQPVALIAAAVRNAARRPGSFGRVSSEGSEPLRDWFADRIDRDRRRNILIMPGGQAALSLIFRAVCLPGDPVLMAAPTYIGALVAARSAGLVPAPVPVDEGGMCTDQLEHALDQTGARVVYVQSRFQNPTGASLGAQRCRELVDLAERRGLLILEDDWISDLAVSGNTMGPLTSMDEHGHVIHVRSLTKSVAPGVRVAAIASSGSVAARLHQVRSAEDFFVSPLLQETALGVVTSTRWPAHLRRLRSSLMNRRDLIRGAVNKFEGVTAESAAGDSSSPMHVWCRVEGLSLAANISEVAMRHGVSVIDGRAWYPGTPDGHHLRLSGAASNVEDIELGMCRLASALDELRSAKHS